MARTQAPLSADACQRRLSRLRALRVKPEPDLSLGFLKKRFRQEIEKPHRQLAALVELWAQLVPETLHPHCRLESLSRGVLRVVVSSSAWHYELDRHLREGLREQLILRHRGPAFNRIQVRVDAEPFREEDQGPD